MELQSQEISYSKDSRRIKDPQSTVERNMEILESKFDVKKSEITHEIAPGLCTAIVEGENVFYWKNRTVSRGKGLTYKQSMASAVAEYIERYVGTKFIEKQHGTAKENGKNEKIFLEQLLPPLEESSRCKNELLGLYPSMLGDTCPLKKGRWRDRFYMLLPWMDDCGCWKGLSTWERATEGIKDSLKLSAEQEWIEFYSLNRNEQYELPFEIMTATTNGLASGNCIEEAALHGMLEVIERDESFRKLPIVDIEHLKDNHQVSPKDLPQNVREKFDSDVLDKFIILHSRSELCPEVHVFQVLAIWEPGKSNIISPDIEVSIGKGASLDPEYAAQRAVTEVFQGISSYEARKLIEPDLDFDSDYRKLENIENNSTGDLKKNIELIKESLKEDSEIFLKELPSEEFDLSVVKCVIKNALGPHIPRVGQDFYTEALNYSPSLIEKQGIKSMRAYT